MPALSRRDFKPGSGQWRQLVLESAAELGVEMTDVQVKALACHAVELIKWNKKINLTRISDPVEMALKHYVDALGCVPHVPAGARVLDIGTGGGFPGIPVAVAAQAESVLMIDSVRKKISFLQHVIRIMQLHTAEAMHIRAQELQGRPGYGEAFDIIICRALTGIEHIIELAFPLLKPGGRVVALKGRPDEVEKEWQQYRQRGDRPCKAHHLRTVSYRLPVLEVARCLVLIEK